MHNSNLSAGLSKRVMGTTPPGSCLHLLDSPHCSVHPGGFCIWIDSAPSISPPELLCIKMSFREKQKATRQREEAIDKEEVTIFVMDEGRKQVVIEVVEALPFVEVRGKQAVEYSGAAKVLRGAAVARGCALDTCKPLVQYACLFACGHRFPCAHLPCLARALYTVVVTES